jgi:DNA-binding transcriptional regulator LsrR (DeoR family)
MSKLEENINPHKGRISERDHDQALDKLCELLPTFFSRTRSGRDIAKDIFNHIQQKTGKAADCSEIDANIYFWNLLKDAYNEGRISVRMGRSADLESRLLRKYRGLADEKSVRVVDINENLDAIGSLQKLSRAAAEEFLDCLADVARHKTTSSEINIGVVGGKTCRAIYDALLGMNLAEYLTQANCPHLRDREICIYPLNSLGTHIEHYNKSQALVIASNFADYFESHSDCKVKLYGFYGPVLTQDDGERAKLIEQNRAVFLVTDPSQVSPGTHESQLDVILMSLGGHPKAKATVLSQVIDEDKLKALSDKGCVGDVLYFPLDEAANPITLDHETPFSAISLDALRKLARTKYRHIIAVAMSYQNQDKTDVIHAAIGNPSPLANRLVTSVATADSLLQKFSS